MGDRQDDRGGEGGGDERQRNKKREEVCEGRREMEGTRDGDLWTPLSSPPPLCLLSFIRPRRKSYKNCLYSDPQLNKTNEQLIERP